MSIRPKPPTGFNENPPLTDAFFAGAKPASLGENARLRAALEDIIKAHESGAKLDAAIKDAKAALHAAE
jgi:hypothetical protein